MKCTPGTPKTSPHWISCVHDSALSPLVLLLLQLTPTFNPRPSPAIRSRQYASRRGSANRYAPPVASRLGKLARSRLKYCPRLPPAIWQSTPCTHFASGGSVHGTTSAGAKLRANSGSSVDRHSITTRAAFVGPVNTSAYMPADQISSPTPCSGKISNVWPGTGSPFQIGWVKGRVGLPNKARSRTRRHSQAFHI